MKYKVMIVEDQTMPRELFELRVQASERFELALSIDNAALADVYCLRFPVDLILMDVITRDGENGLDAAARIKRAFPQITTASGLATGLLSDAEVFAVASISRATKQIIVFPFLKFKEGVSKCTPSLFYVQSPDFHKLGLCYYLKILYL